MESMKNKIVLPVLFFVILLSACGGEKTAATEVAASADPVISATPDPCSEAALPGEVEKINNLMREFDDYSRLASSAPQGQLIQVIPPMQEVRRRAESQDAPVCLLGLKRLQVAHMNTVIETLMVFMANPQAEDINRGITQARELHLKYDIEIARLLGITVAASPTNMPVATTSAAQTQPTGLSVLNPGPDEVTLFAAPEDDAGGVAVLAAGAVTTAFGRTEDGLWLQVEVPGQPGQKAWVSASLVQVSGEPPVIKP
jgi:hypothetical protein